MAATVQLQRLTGPGAGVGVDISSGTTFWTASDIHYPASPLFPIPVPVAGTNYSYWTSLRLLCSVTPATALSNIIFFFPTPAWAGGSGITFLGQRANVGANAGYREATGTLGTTGTQLTTGNHTGLVGAPVSPYTWTAAAPLALTGSITNPSTGFFGDLIVTQAVIAAGATGSAQPNTAHTFMWDET